MIMSDVQKTEAIKPQPTQHRKTLYFNVMVGTFALMLVSSIVSKL